MTTKSPTPYMDAMERIGRAERERAAREAQMRNALEILADGRLPAVESWRAYEVFVRATAREGLGRGELPT